MPDLTLTRKRWIIEEFAEIPTKFLLEEVERKFGSAFDVVKTGDATDILEELKRRMRDG